MNSYTAKCTYCTFSLLALLLGCRPTPEEQLRHDILLRRTRNVVKALKSSPELVHCKIQRYGAGQDFVCPINLAVQTTPEMLRIVVDAGADIDGDVDDCGYSALHTVVFMARDDRTEEDAELLKTLLEYRPNMELLASMPPGSPTKMTALCVACEFGNAQQVTLLLEAGADPNHADDEGQTPLHHAAPLEPSKDRTRIVQDLARFGADPSIVDASGKTAFDLGTAEFKKLFDQAAPSDLQHGPAGEP